LRLLLQSAAKVAASRNRGRQVFTTTYATTFGCGSTGIRGDLMTSSPEQNPVNGGRKGPAGVYETTDPITTNQKAAGSSPAERAPIAPANRGFSLCRLVGVGGLTTYLTTYLLLGRLRRRFRGRPARAHARGGPFLSRRHRRGVQHPAGHGQERAHEAPRARAGRVHRQDRPPHPRAGGAPDQT
jgi:hypothetical protein